MKKHLSAVLIIFAVLYGTQGNQLHLCQYYILHYVIYSLSLCNVYFTYGGDFFTYFEEVRISSSSRLRGKFSSLILA